MAKPSTDVPVVDLDALMVEAAILGADELR
jgi:hypothetical protein